MIACCVTPNLIMFRNFCSSIKKVFFFCLKKNGLILNYFQSGHRLKVLSTSKTYMGWITAWSNGISILQFKKLVASKITVCALKQKYKVKLFLLHVKKKNGKVFHSVLKTFFISMYLSLVYHFLWYTFFFWDAQDSETRN